MPGRLEFEHEVDNDAEVVVKDFEFGLVYKYGGDEQPEATITRPAGDEDEEEDEEDGEEAKDKDIEVKKEEVDVKQEPGEPEASGSRRGSASPKKELNGKGKEKAEEPAFDLEDEDELEVKLALLDIYFSKLDKREEAKDLIFDRGLTEYKKVRSARQGCH
jgi:transcriptional adapter 2-alpha